MIQISDQATAKIAELIENSEVSGAFLRFGVNDGGCSGLSYQIRIDDEMQEDDQVTEWSSFKVVVDSASQPFVDGVQIGYKEAGMTGGFTIDNPNAKATCGCGASFRTAAYRGQAKKC
ncbi:iron-sulfur cluster assembly accessory protein [Paenibacillus sp. GYB004]|uniref:HesB/IscA family protein n=1 Tax=Paenibacillus sp. GYB004 TaxID=2994393 RepID=UPI002F9625EB